MTDVFTKEKRSEVMSKITSKNTKPEVLVQGFLTACGYKHRIHAKELPTVPDVVLDEVRTVIFINGCFWHGHSCRGDRFPKTNVDFWRKKIDGNQRRQREALAALKKDKWGVIVVWECELKVKNRDETLWSVASRLADKYVKLYRK
jgi:DNA mismatch endonuclease, patch repair protein